MVVVDEVVSAVVDSSEIDDAVDDPRSENGLYSVTLMGVIFCLGLNGVEVRGGGSDVCDVSV